MKTIYPIFTCQSLQKASTRWALFGFSLLLCVLVLSGAFVVVGPLKAHATGPNAYTISGTAFDDYKQNGVQNSQDPGINGITVKAYNSANTVVASDITKTVGSALGQYTLAIPSGVGPTRVQFTNFGPSSTNPALSGFQPSIHVGGTSVAFVNGANSTNTVNFGLERPSEYCQSNPELATSCYVRGDQTRTTDDVVVRFPYNSSGNGAMPMGLATAPEVGTTWGLAYRRSSDTLFMASYFKRHSGFKPNGSTGAIYSVSGADSMNAVVSSTPFVDLNALFGSNTAGADMHDPTNNYFTDGSAYANVGKISLGGLAMSEDDSTLYAVNLYDKQLYRLPLGAAPNAPAAPSAANITRIAIPVPSSCPTSDFRPFAVSVYRGQVYVGAVCSAESTITQSQPAGDVTKLQAYVFSYTDSNGFVTTPVMQFPLNYTRLCANDANSTSACLNTNPADWTPWKPTFSASASYTTHPQPMLSSIAFDNGNMILGIRDRFGDQMGVNAPAPTGGSNLYNGITAGDTLRACLQTPGDITSGWTLESNASCGGVQTNGHDTGLGPGLGAHHATTGNGEYYYQQPFLPYHDYTSLGGVLQIPGLPGVMTTAMDPTTNIDSGGTRTFDNTTGAQTNNFQIYVLGNNPNSFSKSNGLGSLTAFCHSAPIEIGDRVWLDSRGNGLQDADDTPIANVTVHLYAADGTTLLSTTTTDARGYYYFSISPYTSYVIKLDKPSDYTTGPLSGDQLTSAFQDTNGGTIDSKGLLPQPTSSIGAGNYPQAIVAAHNPGENDYNFDFGFTFPPDLSIVKTHTGGNSFQVGQSVTYHLQVSNSSDAGPVVASNAITVTDPIPAGLQQLTASGTNWNITLSSTTSPVTMTATYTGAYPVNLGTALPTINITGILASAAVGNLTNTATVSTPNDSGPLNNSSSNSIVVNVVPTPTPGITPTPTVGVTPTPTPGITPTPTIGVTPTPGTTPTPGITPTPGTTPTPKPTATKTPGTGGGGNPTPVATPKPKPTSTPIPSGGGGSNPPSLPGLPPTGDWS